MTDLPKMDALFDSTAFEAVLCQWAENAAGIVAIWDAEDGPQPDRPFVVFALISSDDITGTIRNDEYNATTQKIERGYYKLQEVHVQVTALTESNKPGENAQRVCEQLITALWSDAYKEGLFLPAEIGLNTLPTTVKRLPMLEDGVRWKSKAMFEVGFTVACNQASVESVGAIDSARVDGTLVGGVNGDVTATQTVTS